MGVNDNQGGGNLNSIFNTTNVEIKRAIPQAAQVQVAKAPTGGSAVQVAQSKTDVPSEHYNGVTDEQKKRWADKALMSQLVPSIAYKINAIGSELKQIIVERSEMIDAIMVAITIGQHVVMLGDPGIAKSMMAREICKRIVSGKYFEWLLNKTSDPSEILGPYSIKKLEQDRFARKTDEKLPEAHVGFLDEIFKCNEPTLNALLAITNERIFHNDGKPHPIPLITLFGASNEEPDDQSLNALYDRMLFRFMVKPVGDAGNRLKMYGGFINRRNPQAVNNICSSVTVDELNDIRHAARYVIIPQDVINTYDMILMELRNKNQIQVTDRRKNEGLSVIQGTAMLDGRDVASVDDFRHLTYVWWQRPEDIKVVESVIMRVVNPYESKIKEEKANIDQILAKVAEATDDATRANAAIEAKSQLNNVIRNLDNLSKQAKNNGKDTKKIDELRLEVYNHQKVILNKNLGIDEGILQSHGFGDLGSSSI